MGLGTKLSRSEDMVTNTTNINRDKPTILTGSEIEREVSFAPCNAKGKTLE